MTDRVELPGSHRDAPAAPCAGPVAPGERITVSVYLKGDGGDPLLDLPPRAEPGVPVATRQALAAERHAAAHAVHALTRYATAHGLTVAGHDAARRVVTLSGTAAALSAAFGASLAQYDGPQGPFRARTGALTLPSGLAGSVAAVLGLDQRPVATPKLQFAPRATSGFRPNTVGAIYGFPAGAAAGAGQTIGIIELGGGFRASDTAAAFAAMGLAAPEVVAVGVSGGTNDPTSDPNANGEVALDIQVAGGVAPGARIAVYFAPNTTQGFVDAISTAVHDKTNAPSVISISWGSAEVSWTAQALTAMQAALKDAATLGVTVFAASGDNLASDGVDDGAAHVDFPASSPYVVGCGGTRLTASGTARQGEVVWNAGSGGTGGGVSAKFARPAFQAQANVPSGPAGGGRGVPDVAGDADPASGYLIVVDGQTQQIGGTSAVAPLWAGLTAAINSAAGKPVGFALPVLYGNAQRFNDITEGDNKVGSVGFAAGPGWDACTGLGTPIGAAL
ncbi:MAG: hypothetical protein JO290_09855, partial [Sphingomonadaceae bacterium]|nr:hypothetical protein [Sphingomonadaceae bacterium]